MAIATPLSVSGRWITDANGNRVKLAGVNWAGAHQDAMTPGGLDYRQRDDIAAQIAEWGFNSVRFPFALQTVTWGSPVASSGVAANPVSLNRSQKSSALLSTTPRLRTRSSTNDFAPLRRM
jgi:aryl-phospho-beta-D-glucosidase BglC (GH1 family)